jgi:NMD protein affecting ribosome stability and mRNA decay
MKPNRLAAVPNSAPRHSEDLRSANDENPYAMQDQLETAECPTCHATFQEGKWTWAKAPSDTHKHICPACQRIHDQFPAGYVTIKGEFFAEHKDEIIALLRSQEEHEKSERPLQRIMAIDQKRDGIEVSTTDPHIARTLAQALHNAYKGDLKLRYSRDENLLRASWKR